VYLKKLESFTVNKIVIALETMNIGKVLFLAYADGTVEYRDRLTMTETFNDGDLDRVWHLSQIGFSYPDDDPCMCSHPITCNRTKNEKAFKSRYLPATVLWCRLEMMER
jgi:Mediator complex subunit 16